MAIKFFWNGFKGSDGKLHRVFYSEGPWTAQSGFPEGTVRMYRRDYGQLPADVVAAFNGDIQNDSDTMTDYFETDDITVRPSHPLYGAVKAAMAAKEARNAKRYGERHRHAA